MSYSIIAKGTILTNDRNGIYYYSVDNVRNHLNNHTELWFDIFNKIVYKAKNNQLYDDSGLVMCCTVFVYNNGIPIYEFDIDLQKYNNGKLKF